MPVILGFDDKGKPGIETLGAGNPGFDVHVELSHQQREFAVRKEFNRPGECRKHSRGTHVDAVPFQDTFVPGEGEGEVEIEAGGTRGLRKQSG